MSNALTVEDVLTLVEERAQWLRSQGPADMRDMLYFVRSIRNKVKAEDSREDILKYYADADLPAGRD